MDHELDFSKQDINPLQGHLSQNFIHLHVSGDKYLSLLMLTKFSICCQAWEVAVANPPPKKTQNSFSAT